MKQKSIQKYIFRSNTIMIIVVMLSAFLILGGVYLLYQFQNKPNLVKNSELASNSSEVYEIIEQSSLSDSAQIVELAEKLREQNFYLWVTQKKRKTVFLNLELSSADQRQLHDFIIDDSEIHTFIMSGMTIMTRKFSESNRELYVFNENEVPLVSPLRRILRSIMYVTAILSIFISVLSIVSSFFMRRLSKRIMEPLQLLSEAADRIKEENYSENIQYHGDYEFEDVCLSFNDMQHEVAKARKQQREYEKARTDMVAGISHDLRTPLTAIQGTLKGLLDGVAKTPEIQKKFLEIAFRRSVEMNHLLDQLFYFSKIETGNMPVHLQRVNWSEYLQEYIEKRRVMDEERIQYYFHKTGDGIASEIDRKEMERILDNLIENSKKYAKRDDLVISINLSTKADRVYLWVTDNGEGVPEDKLTHIFEKFYRADESRNETEGNGLGLHIVKYLTEAMSGNVTAKNNDGLEIRFDFPSAQGEG
ncbi:MAG: HAMP domain-containing sensor histidine kinase [Eubacteriales bacterium]|nr:HAMP domain-containing sensor histidine kinase [Eubacteriales bacterium]